ncbi:MAG: BON domain-containing protein [Chitinivibrionales bacterium]|nr:BON domain-containing protein [Chitinivibrionales bacterium]
MYFSKGRFILESETIKRSIIDHLYWDQRVDASHVTVEIADETVRLSGSVPSALARASAEYDAWVVEGVKSVDNELTIEYPQTTELPSGEVVQREIERTLLWNPNIDAKRISVEMRGGTAVLNGEVDAYWKKSRVEELVLDVTGVLSVGNHLNVNPRRSLSDREIAQSITEALKRDKTIDQREIEVSVTDGIVKLQGKIPDRQQRIAVQSIAGHSMGVVDVINELSTR